MKALRTIILGMVLSCSLALPSYGQIRILPLGDSVTSSFSPYSSYRYWLWQQLTTNGFTTDFVGRRWGVEGGLPEKRDYDMNHEGHAGWHADDGMREAYDIAVATQPHVILLDLGANDVEQAEDNLSTIEELRIIIHSFREINPNIIILLAQPTPVVEQKKQFRRLLPLIRRLARQENTPESPVVAVNLFSQFRLASDTFDGVHPNERGEKKIALRYFRALSRILN
jgi:acyl-CoA thioesterase I